MTMLFLFSTLGTLYLRHAWPPPFVIGGSAMAVTLVLWLYSRERTLSPARRVLLAGMRALLCVVLLLLLLEPVLGVDRSTLVPANVLVLVDLSESMTQKDQRRTEAELREAAHALGKVPFSQHKIPRTLQNEVRTTPRIELVQGLLNHPEIPFFREPGQRYQLRFFSFGKRLEPGPEDPTALSSWLKGQRPEARETRLGDALDETLARYRGQPIAGVIVLTDGASNAGPDPLTVAQRLRIPIFPVGTGLPDPEDVQLRSLLVAPAIFPGDRVTVRGEITASPGFKGHTAQLILREDGVELARKPVVLRAGSQVEGVEFVPKPGKRIRLLSLSVEPLVGEATNNNQKERPITVIDKKIRVLYVEGKPRWEYRYLKAVLERDHRLEVQFLLTEGDPDLPSASPQFLARLPASEANLFRYDLIILGDVPASTFTPKQLSWLERLVREKGGSLLMLAGSRHAPMTYLETPVTRLLPVRLGTEGTRPVSSGVHPILTPRNLTHPVVALESDPEQTRQLWQRVRPLYEVPRLEGAKPAATVLATLSEPDGQAGMYPLIAWHRHGTGKVLFVGTDQLWRLRYRIGDRYHATIWGQAIRFLTLARLLGANRRIRLELTTPTVPTGERVKVLANVLDSTFQPFAGQRYTVFVEEVSAQAQPRAIQLQRVRDVPGLFEGFLSSEKAGTFQIRPRLEDQPNANTATLQVTAMDREQREPAMQETLLRKLAEVSGGKYLEVTDLAHLTEHLPDQAEVCTLPPEETPLWDHWLIVVIVLAWAGTEWFLRRSWDVA